MDWEITLEGLGCVAIGATLLWAGWNNWKHRDTEAIPWIEDKILAVTDEEPLPRTRFDRISRRVQAALGLVLGLFHLSIGISIILYY